MAEFKVRGSAEFSRSTLLTWPFYKFSLQTLRYLRGKEHQGQEKTDTVALQCIFQVWKVLQNQILHYWFLPCAKISNTKHLMVECKFHSSAELWHFGLLTWLAWRHHPYVCNAETNWHCPCMMLLQNWHCPCATLKSSYLATKKKLIQSLCSTANTQWTCILSRK